MDTIEHKIRSLVSEISGIDANADAGQDLYSDLGLVSFHALRLLTELEERFDVHIPDEEFVQAHSISAITSLIRGLLDHRAG